MAKRGVRVEDDCKVRVRDGARVIDSIIDDVKKPIYEYNSIISSKGYYLKPVHRVYRHRSDGTRKIYEYYGRYFWRIETRGGRKRLVYAGTRKPRGLPDPPRTGLEGLVVLRESNSNDVIIDCHVYERFKHLFEGMNVEKL